MRATAATAMRGNWCTSTSRTARETVWVRRAACADARATHIDGRREGQLALQGHLFDDMNGG